MIAAQDPKQPLAHVGKEGKQWEGGWGWSGETSEMNIKHILSNFKNMIWSHGSPKPWENM